MDKKELLNFCIEKKVLLDKDLLEIFSNSEDFSSVKMFIEQIQSLTNKNIITKEVLNSNKDNLREFFLSDPRNKEILKELTIKFGLNLEISAKIHSQKELINNLEKEQSKVKILNSYSSISKDFGVKDFINYFRNRFNEMKNYFSNNVKFENLISINRLSKEKQNVSLIGMVLDKSLTKNKNFILEIEDLTGRIKLLISKEKSNLIELVENISLDSVLCFKCSGNKEVLFVNEIIYPDSDLPIRKKSPVEEYALFISDLHFGSKKFFKEEFFKFIDYLNGKDGNLEEVNKIKYLFIVGDVVTGVGNYPDQEKDLEFTDLEKQFQGLADALKLIRKDIQIIISPGNHDGVRLMEPQPIFDEKYAWPLYNINNIFLVSNPSLINISERKGFEGFNILVYHGFSFNYFARAIPKLISADAMNHPEKIMEYLLMNRHLAPTHGSVQYVPSEKDFHIIKKIPDIFVSGHTHKSDVFYYNNILVISGSTWEAMTTYQEKFGNIPDHCKVPMVNLKTRAVKILDFENYENKEEEKK
ncbi:MAG: metallophosphoesterase [Candidatus Pacearchaeota archaeon]|jgi:DNA polymerase II small subunit